MSTACYPLASPSGTVRLWLGVHPATAPPAVDDWRLDGIPVDPANLTALRPLQSVRSGALLAGDPPRAWTGVYEIVGVTPGTLVTVSLRVDGAPLERRVRLLPARLELDGDPLNVLLVSCFHYRTDAGLYGQLLPRILRGVDAPGLAIFVGDQVYLDLPTLQNFPDDAVWLADKFERDYVRNWLAGSFSEGLGAAPLAFIPDDHEYWNNFPHPSAVVQNSWSHDGRVRWRNAAQACYDGFQLGVAGAPGRALELDIRPLGFLVLDTRTHRNEDRRQLLDPATRAQVAAWTARVAGDPVFVAAVIAVGQALVENPAGRVKGGIVDYGLADHEPAYRELLAALTTLTEAGKPVLLLTGDVHWGRVVSVRDRQRDATVLHEVISSPASLVETIIADEFARAIGAVKRWFGAADPWPRHGDAQAPPSHVPHSGQRFRTEGWRGHRGNQVVLLRMARRGAGVAVDYTFHPLSTSDRATVPSSTGRVDLSPIR